MSHVADALAAPISFASVKFGSLTKGKCEFAFNSEAWKAAESAATNAKNHVSENEGKLAEAKALEAREQKAAEAAVKACQCRVYTTTGKAFTKATEEFASTSQKAWTEAVHLQCVLKGTPVNGCTVPALPEIRRPTLAAGVTADAC